VKPKRLLVVLAAAVITAAAVLGGVYYGTALAQRGGPAYTRPANPVEKWDGPGADPGPGPVTTEP
jgi:hypothetical protein